MRVLTYYKSFKQQVWHYCFDMIRELEKRIKEDQEELEFFKTLQLAQNRCEACNGIGDVTTHFDIDERSVDECKVCKGTGDGPEYRKSLHT